MSSEYKAFLQSTWLLHFSQTFIRTLTSPALVAMTTSFSIWMKAGGLAKRLKTSWKQGVCLCFSSTPTLTHTHTHISLCLTVWVHNAHSSSELCIMIDIFSSTFFLSKLRITQTWCTYTVWLPGLWNVVFPVTWWYECEASAWASGVL